MSYFQGINKIRRTVLESSDLSGRLSIVDSFPDYSILTSEGEDQGYWIFFENGKTKPGSVTLNPLGFDVPGLSEVGILGRLRDDYDNDDAENAGLEEDTYYAYRFTYLRVANEPFGYVESKPTDPQVARTQTGGRRSIQINGFLRPEDPEVTHFGIYRTSGLGGVDDVSEFGAEEFAEKAIYRRIAQVPVRRSDTYIPIYVDSRASHGSYADEFGELERLDSFNHDRLPITTKSLAFHEGLVFAACGNEVRYCKIDFGNIYTWAWPIKNSLTPGGEYDFVFSYGGLLYFGDGQQTYRLEGNSPANFAIDSIASTGPVDPIQSQS